MTDKPRPPLYVRLKEGTVTETRELVMGNVFTDHDAEGNMLGIEVLSPHSIDISQPVEPSEIADTVEVCGVQCKVPDGWTRWSGS